MQNHKKLIITIIVAVLAVATVSGWKRYSAWKEECQREQDYQDGIAAIEAGDYMLAKDLLRPLREEESYPDAKMLYMYALLKDDKESDAALLNRHYDTSGYDEDYDGLYAAELSVLVQEIEEEYEANKKAKEARKEKQQKEYYASILPFEGMDEEHISDTMVGAYDDKSYTLDAETYKITSRVYSWYAENTEIVVLKVVCKDREVYSVKKYHENAYWHLDGTPWFEDDGHAIVNYHSTSGGSSSPSGGSSSSYSSSGNNSSSSSSGDGYDDGYDGVYFDEDYDEDRYNTDQDYADGVDDAMDDIGEYW